MVATARSPRVAPRVPLGICWLAWKLRPNRSSPKPPKTADTGIMLLAC
jgi:hypothetical protein